MTILFTPLTTLLPTLGAVSRVLTIAEEASRRGHKIVLTLGESYKNRELEAQYKVYYSSEPIPLGLPAAFKPLILKKLSKISDTHMDSDFKSFDSILKLTGGIAYSYLYTDFKRICEIIEKEKVDLLYTEYRLAAIAAADKMNIPAFSGYTQMACHEGGYNPKTVKGLNKLLRQEGLECVESPLHLLMKARWRIVPSIPEIEKFRNRKGLIYCGSLTKQPTNKVQEKRQDKDHVLVYLGTGGFLPKQIKRVIFDTFKHSDMRVHVCDSRFTDAQHGHIHFHSYLDFKDFLPKAALFINHGGQNSVMSGLLNGVPQIHFPGNYFERRFNAASLSDRGCSITCGNDEFNAVRINTLINDIAKNREEMILKIVDLAN